MLVTNKNINRINNFLIENKQENIFYLPRYLNCKLMKIIILTSTHLSKGQTMVVVQMKICFHRRYYRRISFSSPSSESSFVYIDRECQLMLFFSLLDRIFVEQKLNIQWPNEPKKSVSSVNTAHGKNSSTELLV